MRKFIVFLSFFLPSAALAEPTIYECVVPKANGPIAERLTIEFEGQTIRVIDDIVQYFEGGPVFGKTGVMNDKKSVANWNVMMTSRSGQGTKMAYRAVVFANGRLIVTAKPHGYANQFSGRGQCRLSSNRVPGS
ncbi:hypothetical protein N9C96_01490 [bacterium]|nr:hypothetical protein [bacterium]